MGKKDIRGNDTHFKHTPLEVLHVNIPDAFDKYTTHKDKHEHNDIPNVLTQAWVLHVTLFFHPARRHAKWAPRLQTTFLYFMPPRWRPKCLPRHLGREDPSTWVPVLVAVFGPLSRPKLPGVLRGVQRYPFQRPSTNATGPDCTPITRYVQKLPLMTRGYHSLFLCSTLCTCATCGRKR